MMRMFGMLAALGVLAGALVSSPVQAQPKGGFGKGGFGKDDFKKEAKDSTKQLQVEIEKLQEQVKELQAALGKKGNEAKKDGPSITLGGMMAKGGLGGKIDADNIKIFIERIMQDTDAKKSFQGKKGFEGKKGPGDDFKKKFEERKKEGPGAKIDRDEIRSIVERILKEREGKKGFEGRKGAPDDFMKKYEGMKKRGFGGPPGFGRGGPESSRSRSSSVEARIDRIIGELESLRKELKK